MITDRHDSRPTAAPRPPIDPWRAALAREPRSSARLSCLAHFLAWLDKHDVPISDCSADDVVAYEASLARFRPGVRSTYGQVAQDFVAFVAAVQDPTVQRARRRT
jgi:hypothetical protein